MKQQNEIGSMLKELSLAEFSASQAKFFKGLRKWYRKTGDLTAKQYACLKSMYESALTQNEFAHQLNSDS
jgi:hypothetical protein